MQETLLKTQQNRKIVNDEMTKDPKDFLTVVGFDLKFPCSVTSVLAVSIHRVSVDSESKNSLTNNSWYPKTETTANHMHECKVSQTLENSDTVNKTVINQSLRRSTDKYIRLLVNAAH